MLPKHSFNFSSSNRKSYFMLKKKTHKNIITRKKYHDNEILQLLLWPRDLKVIKKESWLSTFSVLVHVAIGSIDACQILQNYSTPIHVVSKTISFHCE